MPEDCSTKSLSQWEQQWPVNKAKSRPDHPVLYENCVVTRNIHTYVRWKQIPLIQQGKKEGKRKAKMLVVLRQFDECRNIDASDAIGDIGANIGQHSEVSAPLHES